MQTAKARAISYKELIASAVSLIAIFVVLLLSIIILVDPALGWFANNEDVTADQTEFVVDPGDATAEYVCYVYNATNGQSSPIEIQSITALDMQPFDMIFEKRNRYAPAVIRIALTDIKPQYATSGTVNITINRDTLLPDDELNDYFSSIMRFTAIIGSTYYSADNETLYGNIDTALYTTVKDYAQNYSSATSKMFTTVTGGTGTNLDPFTYSKADSITLSVPYTSSDKNGDVLNVYLYLSYDKALVNKYRAAEGIDTSSTAVGRTVSMADDMETLSISFS